MRVPGEASAEGGHSRMGEAYSSQRADFVSNTTLSPEGHVDAGCHDPCDNGKAIVDQGHSLNRTFDQWVMVPDYFSFRNRVPNVFCKFSADIEELDRAKSEPSGCAGHFAPFYRLMIVM